jgi:glycosyltransferase involved in cell wall biosynthesis
VLHVVEHWVRPSEGFVLDVVRSTTSTRAVVAAHHPRAGSAADGWPGRVYDLSGCPDAAQADPGVQQRGRDLRSRAVGTLPVRHALAAIAIAERADVLHAHFALTAHQVWRVARRLHLPFCVSVHGWDLLVAARQDDAMLDAVRAADLVVTPSRFLADEALRLGVPEQVLRVVPSGLDLSTLEFRERRLEGDLPPTVTYAGRFAAKKGVLDVARAVATAADTHPLHARFVGHGPLEPELRDLLAELGLAADVVDGRPAGAVRAALAATDLVVTGSRTAADGDAETLGLVNLEAQACGVPLVTTRHGGIPEAVSSDGALLVPAEGDVAAHLATAVSELLAHPERWAAMGRAGRRHVAAHFELGARTADLEQLWRSLAKGPCGAELPALAPPQQVDRVAVVLVTHNRRDLLARCLDALSRQTRPADEVVVVDNGSDDGTSELLADHAARGHPAGLVVLRRPSNLPVAEGRNLGVAAATAPVIAFTDDDCRPRPTWLECLLAGLTDRVGLVQGRTTADPAQPLEPLSRTQWTPAEFGLYETCNIAYTRAALEAAGPTAPTGPFDLGFAELVARTLGGRWRHLPFGEDTELGWRVRRRGAGSRFAVHAVVDHEVSPPDPTLLLRRAALAAAFPVVVREVPELRETFLWHRYVLGRHRALMWAAVGGLAAAAVRRDLRPALLCLPYVDDLVGLRTLHVADGRRRRLAAGWLGLSRDAVETVALLRGSLRSRTLVL